MDLCCLTCAQRAKKPGLATGLCFYSVIRNPSGNIPNCGSSGRKRRGAPESDGSHVAIVESCGRITRSPRRISASVCRKSLTPIEKSSRRQSVCGSSSDRTKHQSCAAIGPPSTVLVNQNTASDTVSHPDCPLDRVTTTVQRQQRRMITDRAEPEPVSHSTDLLYWT